MAKVSSDFYSRKFPSFAFIKYLSTATEFPIDDEKNDALIDSFMNLECTSFLQNLVKSLNLSLSEIRDVEYTLDDTPYNEFTAKRLREYLRSEETKIIYLLSTSFGLCYLTNITEADRESQFQVIYLISPTRQQLLIYEGNIPIINPDKYEKDLSNKSMPKKIYELITFDFVKDAWEPRVNDTAVANFLSGIVRIQEDYSSFNFKLMKAIKNITGLVGSYKNIKKYILNQNKEDEDVSKALSSIQVCSNPFIFGICIAANYYICLYLPYDRNPSSYSYRDVAMYSYQLFKRACNCTYLLGDKKVNDNIEMNYEIEDLPKNNELLNNLSFMGSHNSRVVFLEEKKAFTTNYDFNSLYDFFNWEEWVSLTNPLDYSEYISNQAEVKNFEIISKEVLYMIQKSFNSTRKRYKNNDAFIKEFDKEYILEEAKESFEVCFKLAENLLNKTKAVVGCYFCDKKKLDKEKDINMCACCHRRKYGDRYDEECSKHEFLRKKREEYEMKEHEREEAFEEYCFVLKDPLSVIRKYCAEIILVSMCTTVNDEDFGKLFYSQESKDFKPLEPTREVFEDYYLKMQKKYALSKSKTLLRFNNFIENAYNNKTVNFNPLLGAEYTPELIQKIEEHIEHQCQLMRKKPDSENAIIVKRIRIKSERISPKEEGIIVLGKFIANFVNEHNRKMKKYQFKRFVNPKSDKFMLSPAHTELIATLIDQPESTSIINSWCVKDGVLVLMNMNADNDVNKLGYNINLFFLPSGFCGRYPPRILWSADMDEVYVSNKCKIIADYNERYNILCMIYQNKHKDGEYDQILETINISNDFKKANVVKKHIINFIQYLYHEPKNKKLYTFPTGLLLKEDGTKGMITIKTIQRGGNYSSYFLYFDPFKVMLLKNKLKYPIEEDYDIIPLYYNDDNNFYVGGMTKDENHTVIITNITKKEVEDKTVIDAKAVKRNCFNHSLEGSIAVNEIDGKIATLFISESTKNASFDFFEGILKTEVKEKFGRKEELDFVVNTFNTYGFSEVECAILSSNSYSVIPNDVKVSKYMIMDDDEDKDRDDYDDYKDDYDDDDDDDKESDNEIPEQLVDKDGKPRGAAWPFIFKFCSLPRLWFSLKPLCNTKCNEFDQFHSVINSDAKVNVATTVKLEETKINLLKSVPYIPTIRSNILEEKSKQKDGQEVKQEKNSFTISFIDLFDKADGANLISSISGLQFFKLQDISCAIGCQYCTQTYNGKSNKWPQSLYFIPTVYLKQEESRVSFIGMNYAYEAGDIVFFNIGSADFNLFLKKFKYFLEDKNTIEELLPNDFVESKKILLIICDTELNKGKIKRYNEELKDVIFQCTGLYEEDIDGCYKVVDTRNVISEANDYIKRFKDEGKDTFSTLEQSFEKICKAGASFGAFNIIRDKIL